MNQKVEFIESYIKIGNGNYLWNDNHGVLIRCKDCKHRETYQCPVHVGCSGGGYDEPDEWFCADGERKEGR